MSKDADLPDLAGFTWYHGSPERLTVLRVDSATTLYREIARAFSHKPPLVSVNWPDDPAEWRSSGPISVRHNGSRRGPWAAPVSGVGGGRAWT